MANHCFQFASNVSCYSAITWSIDNRISICTDDSLKVLALVPVVDQCSEQPHFQQSFIPVDNEVYDMPKFTMDDYQLLIKKLSRDDNRNLATDTLMNPKSSVSVSRRGFSAATWSPQGGDDVGRCILAGLSHDFRLCVFSQKSSAFDWHKICDLTDMYWNINSFQGDRFHMFKKFKDHCHEQAVVAISWSPSVFTETIMRHEEIASQKFSVLATVSQTGMVVLWRINLPCHHQSDCSVLHKVKPYSSHPLCMSWSKSTGILAIGYTDGQIHAVKIDMKDPSQDAILVSIYSESDLMRVSCLTVLTHPEVEGEIVLANKEQHILACTVTVLPDLKVTSETFVEGENILHGTGFAGKLGTILMSSADGIIQLVQLNMQERSLQLGTEKVQLDLNSSLHNSSRTYSWLIYGIATSPNNVFMAYIARPSSAFDHLALKWSTKVHIIALNTLKKKSSIALNMPQTSQEQMAAANMDSYMDRNVFNLLKDETALLCDMMDVLEASRCELYSHRTVDWYSQDESLVGKSLKSLKIKRYHFLVKYHTKYKVIFEKPILERYEMEEEVKIREEKKRLGAELLEHIHKITELIVAIHIITCADYLSINRLRIERTNQVNKSIKIMLEFITSRPYLMDLRPDLSLPVRWLKELLENTDVREDTCPICASNLSVSAMTSSCEKGHSFGICSKTLLLCDSMDYRTCSICYSLALSKSRLKDFPWIPGDENRCSICDGLLL